MFKRLRQLTAKIGRGIALTLIVAFALFPLIALGRTISAATGFDQQLSSWFGPKINYSADATSQFQIWQQGVVSITFDDGWKSIYPSALQKMEDYRINSTQYVQSGVFGYPDYMSPAQIKDFQKGGHQIAAHTATHPDLTKLPPDLLYKEVVTSQQDLEKRFGPIKDFASPYGAYNQTTLDLIKQHFRSHRTTTPGLNTRDGFDIYQIKAYSVTPATTTAEIQGWLKDARDQKAWLVLVYHQLDDTRRPFSANPTELDWQLRLIHDSGLPTATMDQVLNQIQAQK